MRHWHRETASELSHVKNNAIFFRDGIQSLRTRRKKKRVSHKNARIGGGSRYNAPSLKIDTNFFQAVNTCTCHRERPRREHTRGKQTFKFWKIRKTSRAVSNSDITLKMCRFRIWIPCNNKHWKFPMHYATSICLCILYTFSIKIRSGARVYFFLGAPGPGARRGRGRSLEGERRDTREERFN